ncbi:MAG: UbiA family prenyltransferase [Chloroflexi bacterium]|nr:UbiA family prenyltransferase [Chloroflexota bacterium]
MADLAYLAVDKSAKRAVIRDLFIHLRLHFQLLLAPIFLWGYFLAAHPQSIRPDLKFWLAFLAFHLFLYGGTTAFNSYYDRDEGPVGGLVKPPPVTALLLPFSLIVQAIGAVLAFLVSLPFAVLYLVDFCIASAYSYPYPRLKSKPLGSMLVIGIGQGILPAVAGWMTANPHWQTIPPLTWLAIVAATLITVGFYPLTQIYQIDEDLARGDLTFAAWVGPQRAFRFTIFVQGFAALLLVGVIYRLLGPINAGVVALFYIALLAAILRWAFTFDNTRILENYRQVMRINMLTSVGFLGFIGLHLFGILS